MTPLKKPVIRKSQTVVRDRSKRRILVAGLLPGDVIRLRCYGCRVAYDLTIEQAYFYAAKLAGEKARRDKKAKGKK